LRLAVGNRPLLSQGEENWQRTPARAERNDDERSGRRRSERPERGGSPRSEGPLPLETDMERYRIEVGWRDRVKPGNIVGAIANEAGLNGRSIGRIQIHVTHSTIDLPRGMPENVFTALTQLRVMNKELRISRLPV
jgi:ATP-dependent RNA helicase DeaD